MKLLYDKNDLPDAKKLHDERHKWLTELGAVELSDTSERDDGFLFAYERGEDHYRRLVDGRPMVLDRPEQRYELVHLDDVLRRLDQRSVNIPTPKTWVIGIDDRPPPDLEFPLFLRTRKSSWKRGGKQARVGSLKQFNDEAELLRRAFGWDTPILARQWIDPAVAGKYMFGDAPQEIRVWIVDHRPIGWSFHYLHVVSTPKGFPPNSGDLRLLADFAAQVGSAFDSRLIVADFMRDRRGKWWFLEAGPGSAAGTAHEAVFKCVADRLRFCSATLDGDAVGGPL